MRRRALIASGVSYARLDPGELAAWGASVEALEDEVLALPEGSAARIGLLGLVEATTAVFVHLVDSRRGTAGPWRHDGDTLVREDTLDTFLESRGVLIETLRRFIPATTKPRLVVTEDPEPGFEPIVPTWEPPSPSLPTWTPKEPEPEERPASLTGGQVALGVLGVAAVVGGIVWLARR